MSLLCSFLSVIPVHYAGVCVLQEAVSELQMQIDSLKHDNDRLTATATDYSSLQHAFADIEAKLTVTQQQLTEQTSLVSLLLYACLLCIHVLCSAGNVLPKKPRFLKTFKNAKS